MSAETPRESWRLKHTNTCADFAGETLLTGRARQPDWLAIATAGIASDSKPEHSPPIAPLTRAVSRCVCLARSCLVTICRAGKILMESGQRSAAREEGLQGCNPTDGDAPRRTCRMGLLWQHSKVHSPTPIHSKKHAFDPVHHIESEAGVPTRRTTLTHSPAPMRVAAVD